jgi:hypothetical protein
MRDCACCVRSRQSFHHLYVTAVMISDDVLASAYMHVDDDAIVPKYI